MKREQVTAAGRTRAPISMRLDDQLRAQQVEHLSSVRLDVDGPVRHGALARQHRAFGDKRFELLSPVAQHAPEPHRVIVERILGAERRSHDDVIASIAEKGNLERTYFTLAGIPATLKSTWR